MKKKAKTSLYTLIRSKQKLNYQFDFDYDYDDDDVQLLVEKKKCQSVNMSQMGERKYSFDTS